MWSLIWRLMVRNAGYPLAAAFFGLSACGLILHLMRMLTGRPHPLTVAFAITTVIAGALFVLAQRRLVRSFKGTS